MRIAILGGTGKQGTGLGLRWALAGHAVLIGSRLCEKAEQAAAALNDRSPAGTRVAGMDNAGAAAGCEVAVLSVPYTSQTAILESVRDHLAGKLLITVVAPLKPPKVARVWHPDGGSAALEAQNLVGEGTPVVAAFQNISALHLADPGHEIDSDVLICGDQKDHKALVEQLVADAGLRAVDVGPLANAGVVEGLTAILIGINARYGVKGAGVRITELST